MDWRDVAYEVAYWSSVEDRAERLGLLGADIEEALDVIEHQQQTYTTREQEHLRTIAALRMELRWRDTMIDGSLTLPDERDEWDDFDLSAN